jgi:hypothetical protein
MRLWLRRLRPRRPTRSAPRSSRRGVQVATTAHGYRRMLAYSPKADGRADPGEVVWALVAYQDQPEVSKDRPVLVVGRKDPRTVLGLMLSSQPKRSDQSDWLARVLELSDRGIRREGAVLDRARFSLVAQALRDRYHWQYPRGTG